MAMRLGGMELFLLASQVGSDLRPDAPSAQGKGRGPERASPSPSAASAGGRAKGRQSTAIPCGQWCCWSNVRGSLKDQVQAGLNPAFPGFA